MTWRRRAVLAVAAGLLAVACSDEPPVTDVGGPTATEAPTAGPTSAAGTAQRYPDVIEVAVTRSDDGTYRFDVTISSPYDSPQRYADAWRVLGPDDTVLGVRDLLHDHANEQPFTRSLDGVEIPADVGSVTVQARDLEYGWGGDTVSVDLPSR